MAGIMRRNENLNLVRPEPFSYQYSFDSTNNVRYYGWAHPGADTDSPVWLICKKVYKGKRLIATQWAGTAEFNQIWDNRTSSVSYTGDGATGSYPSTFGSGSKDVAAASESAILAETGSDMLAETGSDILAESAVGVGAATPLATSFTPITYVVVTPKSTNADPVWIGGSDVTVGTGARFTTSSQPFRFYTDDLRKIYIIGTAGDGVTFTYCTAEDDVSADAIINTDSFGLENTDGEDLENT